MPQHSTAAGRAQRREREPAGSRGNGGLGRTPGGGRLEQSPEGFRRHRLAAGVQGGRSG
jgi:hypothetical protein